MRIAILADALDRQYAGIHIYTKEIIRSLAKIAPQHEWLVVRPEAKGDIAGVEEVVIPLYNIPGHLPFRLFVQIPYVLSQKQVDIVIEPGHFGPFNLPRKIKRVTVIHDLTPLLFPEMHVFRGHALQRLFLPRILRRADHIITNSVYTRSDVIKRFPFAQNKTTAALLGKEAIFQPDHRPEILGKYGITNPYFLFTGTIEPRKNLPVLLKAFEHLKGETGSEHQLVLVGKVGWKSEELVQKIHASPFATDILQLGYLDREDLPAIYSQAIAFVYPSLYEGFGLPVLEAMACGTPVITTNVSSLPEVGGEAACYFAPEDVTRLVAHMQRLSEDASLREQRIQASLQQAAKFSWEKAAKAFVGALEEMA